MGECIVLWLREGEGNRIERMKYMHMCSLNEMGDIHRSYVGATTRQEMEVQKIHQF